MLLDRFPDAQDALFVSGVPKEFIYHRYHADQALNLIQADPGRLSRSRRSASPMPSVSTPAPA